MEAGESFNPRARETVCDPTGSPVTMCSRMIDLRTSPCRPPDFSPGALEGALLLIESSASL
jgi:hypothetical protein